MRESHPLAWLPGHGASEAPTRRSVLSLALLLICGSFVPIHAIVVAAGDPNANLIVGSDPFFGGLDLSGVVEVSSSHGSCSGALLPDGLSILTAGHCVADAFGSPDYANLQARFTGPTNNGPSTGGYLYIAASAAFVNPGWTGNAALGGDLAVLRLSQTAPAYAARYSLYSGMLITTPIVMAGFGFGGTGLTGADPTNYPINGALRAGTNEYVADGSDPRIGMTSQSLIGQFYQAGNPSSNALGVANPYNAADEVDIAPGDSGGPSFYNGQIIGVHDFITCYSDPSNPSLCAVPPSITTAEGSYFGQLFGDTSVAANASWITAQESVPEPATFGMMCLGLVAIAHATLRRAR